jgi:hypothetical protein
MKLVTVYIDPGDAAEAGKHQHQSKHQRDTNIKEHQRDTNIKGTPTFMQWSKPNNSTSS